LADKFGKPIVVTGFEPVDLLYGIYQCILQLEKGTATVENGYKRIVSEQGNSKMQKLIHEMLEPADQDWRGIGIIPKSGLRLKESYLKYDALKKFEHIFNKKEAIAERQTGCIAGEIMRGNKQVADCPFFRTSCNPEHPVGAPMVSAEGVCAAYYNYN